VCRLPHHFGSTLVFPDFEKDRLTEAIIPRPLRKFDLADHHWVDPVTPLHLSSGQPLVPTLAVSLRKGRNIPTWQRTSTTWPCCFATPTGRLRPSRSAGGICKYSLSLGAVRDICTHTFTRRSTTTPTCFQRWDSMRTQSRLACVRRSSVSRTTT